MLISIIGAGNVGSALGAALINKNYGVLFYDIDQKQLDKLTINTNILYNTTTNFKDILSSNIAYICVPTNSLPNGECDTSIIYKVVKQLAKFKYKGIIVQMSTCPPLTARRLSTFGSSKYIVIPSFYSMARMNYDALNPVRVIIGTHDGKPINEITEIYACFGCPIYYDTYEQVELLKYTENVLSATLISYWNEIYLICEELKKQGYNVNSDKLARIIDASPGFKSIYRFHGKAYGSWCTPGNTRVITDKGFRPISEIQAGEWVLSHDGRYHTVNRKLERKYSGPIYSLKSQGFSSTPTIITPEHPVLSSRRILKKRSRFYTTHVEGRGMIKKMVNLNKLEKPKFITPGSIQQGDFMILPKFNEINLDAPTVEMSSVKRHYNIKITPELMYLFGLYLSEGSLYKKKGAISFNFHMKERHFIKEINDIVVPIFNVRATPYKPKDEKSLLIKVTCKSLANYLYSTFGTGAKNKKIPWEWLKLDSSLLIPLLRGMWYGDGSNSEGSNGYPRFMWATVSRNLSDFMQLAFLKLEIPYRIRTSRARTGADGVNHLESYYISGSSNRIMNGLLPMMSVEVVKQEHTTTWFRDRKMFYPIKETNLEMFEGKVYNLEVDGANSYVIEGATLHNCLPKDTKAFIKWSERILKHTPKIAWATHTINEFMKKRFGTEDKPYIYRN